MVKSYLQQRTVIYDGKKPIKFKMTCGAPQGSKIGPLLWNVMYESFLLLKMSDNVSIVGFADDAIVVDTTESAKLLEITVNDSLERTRKWMAASGLRIAVKKTETLLITDKIPFVKPQFTINGEKVRCSKHILPRGRIR